MNQEKSGSAHDGGHALPFCSVNKVMTELVRTALFWWAQCVVRIFMEQ